jgi:hypothetical protein
MPKCFVFLLSLFLLGLPDSRAQVKEYEFGDSFYPKDKNRLKKEIGEFLKRAEVPRVEGEILGIISPHAGYIFSGGIAGFSYKVLRAKDVDTVVLLGPSHRYYFEGATIWPQGFFNTPLGKIEIDQDLVQEFKSLNFVKLESKYFFGEHCLEVQLPFLIESLEEFKILPILFGKLSYTELESLAHKLVELSKNKKIILVVSTDLSHYHPYQMANKIDKETIESIKRKDARGLWLSYLFGEQRACGILPLISFLLYVESQDAKIKILKYANSGDTYLDKTRVVGYLSAVAYKVTSHNSQVTGKKGGR